MVIITIKNIIRHFIFCLEISHMAYSVERGATTVGHSHLKFIFCKILANLFLIRSPLKLFSLYLYHAQYHDDFHEDLPGIAVCQCLLLCLYNSLITTIFS